MTQPAGFWVVPSIGPDGAGKTTLADALARTLYARDPASVSPRRVFQVGALNGTVFEFRTARRLYQYVDYANARTEAQLLASTPIAGAVLLVSALDGVVPAVQESLTGAREAGARRLVVALTKCDAIEDRELLDLVELEVRELLGRFEYAQETSPIVRVSAAGAMGGNVRWGECIPQLAATLDSWV